MSDELNTQGRDDSVEMHILRSRAIAAEDKVSLLTEEVNVLNTHVERLQLDLETSRARAKHLKTVVEQQADKLLEAGQEYGRLLKERDSLRDDVSRLTSELETARSVIAAVIDGTEKYCRALHHQRTTPENIAALVEAICVTDARHVQEKQKAEAEVSRLTEALKAEREEHRRKLVEMAQAGTLDTNEAKAQLHALSEAQERLKQENARLERLWDMRGEGALLAHVESVEAKLFLTTEALRGILEIGKRDMSNPKYDGYFESARQALDKVK